MRPDTDPIPLYLVGGAVMAFALIGMAMQIAALLVEHYNILTAMAFIFACGAVVTIAGYITDT